MTLLAVGILLAKLDNPMTPPDTLNIYLSNFNTVCGSLNRFYQPVSDLNKRRIAKKGLFSNVCSKTNFF